MPQISPGGRGVDYLRSCYRTYMRFSANPDAPLVPIRWKRCAPGTPLIPYPTPFVSRIWDANQAVDLPEALGEVGPRVWDDGGPTTRQWKPGFFGTEAQWREGLEYPTDWGEPGIFGPTPWACASVSPVFLCPDFPGYSWVSRGPSWDVTDPLVPWVTGDNLLLPAFFPCTWQSDGAVYFMAIDPSGRTTYGTHVTWFWMGQFYDIIGNWSGYILSKTGPSTLRLDPDLPALPPGFPPWPPSVTIKPVGP